MTDPLDNPFVARWVEALESGNYKQTQGKLKVKAYDGDRFCCLGVACEVLGPDVGVTQRLDEGIGYDEGVDEPVYVFSDERDSDWLSLPRAVQEALGLVTNEASYHSDGAFTTTCLSADNDSGKTFAEIAEIIRSRPKGLFLVDA